ncbi:MAG: ATP-binding protein [Simkaniaceae bacterium]|nr:ATP-binding protein [Simkaniaceae bacterium]
MEENKITKRFHANTEDLQGIIDFVHVFLNDCFSKYKSKKQIELAVEEMAVNIMNYAYHEKSGPIEIELWQEDPNHLQIEITDWGDKFDPTMLMPREPTSDKIEEIEEGGLGIYLTNRIMDEVRYERLGMENHLILRKNMAGN